jgi:hypothetical protein
MAVPYTFANATTSIPLSQLDSNFATAITLGNTAVYLGNTVSTISNLTLGNVTISSGSATVTSGSIGGNVTINTTGTANTGNTVIAGTLGVTGTISCTKTSNDVFSATAGTTARLYGVLQNTSGSLLYGVESSAGGGVFIGSTAYAAVIGSTVGNTEIAAANNIVGKFSSTGLAVTGVTTSTGASSTSSDFSGRFYNSGSVQALGIRNDGAILTGTSGSGLAACPYNNTTASAANLVVGTGGDLQRSTSSLRYKTDVNDAAFGIPEIMRLRAVTYRGVNDGERVFGGLIAEEVHEAGLGVFVNYDEQGRPDSLAYGNMISLAVECIKQQQALIESLTARVSALESK